jgi:hypothetical protein
MEAIATSVPAPIITLSLMARFYSRQEESFSAQVTAALRNQFGGHAVRVADSIESQVAAESMRSVAPSTPTTPATTVKTSTAEASEKIMDATTAAESAAESKPDAGGTVKDIQTTAQDIYKSTLDVKKN